MTIKDINNILRNSSFPIRLLCYWSWMIGFFHGYIGLPRPKNTSKIVKWASTVNIKEN